jgi:hypothetical protein
VQGEDCTIHSRVSACLLALETSARTTTFWLLQAQKDPLAIAGELSGALFRVKGATDAPPAPVIKAMPPLFKIAASI